LRNFALVLAYDGTPFYGWQKSAAGPTIEGCLEEALRRLLNHPVHVQAASRTDRGVHARGQIVNFLASKELSLRSINALLPKEIRALHLQEMPLSFHPTLDALGKTYLYEICSAPVQLPHLRQTAWHLPYALDEKSMQEGASHLIGKQDFSSLCNMRKNLNYPDRERTLHKIHIDFLKNAYIYIRISGDHFLYKMARNIVGLLVYLGRGKIRMEEIAPLLASKRRNQGAITAPAHGLTVEKIYYPQEIEDLLSYPDAL